MLLTTHVFVGVVIGILVKNPWIALPAALLSHFALDILPHWDFFSFQNKITSEIMRKIYGDVFLGLLVGCYFAYTVMPNLSKAITILGCSFLSIFPDLIEAPYVFWKKEWAICTQTISLQHKLHWKLKFPEGLITQLILIIGCLILLLA